MPNEYKEIFKRKVPMMTNLPPEVIDRIKRLAEADKRTMSGMVRVIVEQGLETVEASRTASQ